MLDLSLSGKAVEVHYTNHRGIIDRRRLMVVGPVQWGSTEFHPEPQWLVPAIDDYKPHVGERLYALKDMRPVE